MTTKRTFRIAGGVLWLALLGPTVSTAQDDPLQYTWRELAPGVWTGIRENSPRMPVMGTTTFVVGKSGVVVFDGGGLPLMSERAIEKISKVTDEPVTHVAVSHWHQDHNFGIRAFLEAYPGVRIVSHHFTRDALLKANMNDAGEFRESVRDTISDNVPQIEGMLETGEFFDGTPLTERGRRRYQQFLSDAELLDREYKRIEPAYPTVTFGEGLVLHQDDREIHFLHLGKGNTAGDIVMWLPDEKIVAAGDLVVRPTPYGYGSYPGQWAETLRKLKALDFETLIPGHGELQRDQQYVDLLIETLEMVDERMEALVADNLSEEEAVEALDLSGVEERFTDGDAFLAKRFEVWFKQPIAQAAYRIETGGRPEPERIK